ncbi:MAG TPA: S41 family peptidase [Rhizomicrobium sp.]|nr:S41 family peptidase [Rhizomicrobium sp.]
MKRFMLAGAGTVGGFLAALALTHIAYGDVPSDPASFSQLNRFAAAFAQVRERYATPTDDRELVYGAIDGMTSNLDPHSSYFDPKTFAAITTKTQGQYAGVGLVIELNQGDGIKVASPIEGTPAFKAGIKAGDVIIAVNGEKLHAMTLDDAQVKLRGPTGSKVTLTVSRAATPKPLSFTLVRADVAVEPVTFKTEGDTGYIKIPAFNDKTVEGVTTAVRTMKGTLGSRLKGYIIDLRNDGGGTLDSAIGVSDAFLNGGEVVSTRGRNPEDTVRYDAKPGDIADGKPIIILVNGGTASASEIVAGALQDHQRARVAGTRSFGKGSVQSIIPLNGGDDGALHLTTGQYYTPSGRSIQAVGIVPDIPVAAAGTASEVDSDIDVTESQLPHHLPPSGVKPAAPKVAEVEPVPGKKYDDFQLDYVVGLLNGKLAANGDPLPSTAKRASN